MNGFPCNRLVDYFYHPDVRLLRISRYLEYFRTDLFKRNGAYSFIRINILAQTGGQFFILSYKLPSGPDLMAVKVFKVIHHYHICHFPGRQPPQVSQSEILRNIDGHHLDGLYGFKTHCHGLFQKQVHPALLDQLFRVGQISNNHHILQVNRLFADSGYGVQFPPDIAFPDHDRHPEPQSLQGLI